MLTLVLANASFVPPTISDGHLPEIFPWGAEYGTGFGKQMLLVLLSVVLITAFFAWAMRRPRLVPGKAQWLAESGYSFVRNDIAKDILGEKNFKQWVPLLFAIFFFVLLNNLFGAIPVLQLPTFSHAGAAYGLALIVYAIWIGVGIKRHGVRYLKLAVVPSGVPGWILPLLVPLEIISNFIVRPLTHSLRLMATMLSGHMIVMLAGAGEHHDHVAGEHGGHQTQGVGQGAHDEVGDDLQRHEQRQDPAGHTGGHDGQLQVAHAVALDADADPDRVDDEGQAVGGARVGEGRQLQHRDGAEQVVQQHEEEDGEEQRDPLLEVLLAQDVLRDVVPDEGVAGLGEPLGLAGHEPGTAHGPREEGGDEHHGEQDEQHLLAEAGAVLRTPGEDLREVTIRDGGGHE